VQDPMPSLNKGLPCCPAFLGANVQYRRSCGFLSDCGGMLATHAGRSFGVGGRFASFHSDSSGDDRHLMVLPLLFVG